MKLGEKLVELKEGFATADIITLAAFGALMLYIVSMLSLFKLRRSEPNLERPYRAPLYPIVPAISCGLACFCMAAMFVHNTTVGCLFAGLVVGSWGLFRISGKAVS